jgi:hypothetical protein
MKKYGGDFPKEHLDLIKELEELELWFDEQGSTVPTVMASKGFTCMAFDYYKMYLDEEGERLLKRADAAYPGYFKLAIHTHVVKDYDFAILVAELIRTPAIDSMHSLGFKE